MESDRSGVVIGLPIVAVSGWECCNARAGRHRPRYPEAVSSSAKPVAAVLTLGCKLNFADSDEISYGLRRAGFEVVDGMCEADAFVINTCSVTHVADAKARKLIRSVRRMAPAATVAVTGCFPQSAGFELARELGADFVAGTRDADKAELVAYLESRKSLVRTQDNQVPLRNQMVRSFVKAQEGCNDVCAFCIVPRTRGREESRSIEQVAEEVNRVVEGSVTEVVLTGTQLGAWGRDLSPAMKPDELISGVLERTEAPRIRFSSLQPQDISPRLLALWQDPRLMPHFHLALQSGSETTLKAMRRRYTALEFLRAAERIRAVVPHAAITTDVIVGFPGETSDDFAATSALCREARFARVHCFPYSVRSKTAAARMTGQLSNETKKERMRELLALGEELSIAFRRFHAGSMRPVLWESRRAHAASGQRPTANGPQWFGHTDNYIAVYTSGSELLNRVTPVQLGEVYHDGVWGRIPGEAV
jgi:threonylcarbamoyladenosine tRNA methylthiotransferase MtaB